MTNLAQCQMSFLCKYKCKFYYSEIEALQNCWYFLSVLNVAWNSTKLTLFLKVKLTKTHIEPNFNCKRLQKWQQTWWSFFGLDKNNWNSQIHPGNTNVKTICLHLWHASVVARHVILYHSGQLTEQNVNLTSVSKKPGQTTVLYHYCSLSRFFWNRR